GGTKGIVADSGEAVELRAIVEAPDNADLEFKWYEYVDTDKYFDYYTEIRLIEGADSPVYTLTPSHKYEKYQLRVKDGYGKQYYATFTVTVDNKLEVYPEGSNGNSDTVTVWVAADQDAVLKTNVSAIDMD
ncbi:hypothetical protein RCJ22_01110, partial [Vibrio sp. FNV 38]|nr:hypothetical protein [Vibrio sp. FNV 38]